MEHEKLIIEAEALRDDIIGVVDRSTDLREVHPAQFKQRVRCLVSNWNASTEDLSPPAAGPSAPFYCAIAKISTFIDAIERFLDLVKDMEACLQEIERDSAWAAQLLARLISLARWIAQAKPRVEA